MGIKPRRRVELAESLVIGDRRQGSGAHRCRRLRRLPGCDQWPLRKSRRRPPGLAAEIIRGSPSIVTTLSQ
eukprot:scaffold68903_cov17-Prasinocladus_malaysianus.AAC.1